MGLNTVAVYFISDGENVKIGYTNQSIQKRLANLQTGSPKHLKVLAVKDSWGKSEEQELHVFFKKDNVGREWFKLSEDLKRYILTINPKAFDASTFSVVNKTTPANNTKEVIACKDWFNQFWAKIDKPQSLKMIIGSDYYHLFSMSQFDNEYLRYNKKWQPHKDFPLLPDIKCKEVKISHTALEVIRKAFSLEDDGYLSSNELYLKYRRYLNPFLCNDRMWGEYSKYKKEVFGVEFLTQRSDIYLSFVDCIVLWAMYLDKPYLNVVQNDKPLIFNAHMANCSGSYTVKHRVERTIKSYVHNDDAANGFFLFCQENGFKGVRNHPNGLLMSY